MIPGTTGPADAGFFVYDEAPAGAQDYMMNEWRCFSSADLKNWKEHPVPLKAIHIAWAKGDAYRANGTIRRIIMTSEGIT